MTESHFAVPGRNRCEVLSTWAAGVAYARSFNIVEHNSDIMEIATSADFFGNRWQVNAIIIPTPIHQNTKAYLQPVAEVMKLFRHHIGAHALKVTGMERQDMTASMSADGKTVYLHVVNPSATTTNDLNISFDGKQVKGMNVFEIAKNPMDEIMETCPDIFLPEHRYIEGSIYKMPPASVAAIEIAICD